MNLPKTEEELKELCIEFANLGRYKPVSTMIEFDKFIAERNKPGKLDIRVSTFNAEIKELSHTDCMNMNIGG